MLKTFKNKIHPAKHFNLYPTWLFISGIHCVSTHFTLYSEEIIIQFQLDPQSLDYKHLVVRNQVIYL